MFLLNDSFGFKPSNEQDINSHELTTEGVFVVVKVQGMSDD